VVEVAHDIGGEFTGLLLAQMGAEVVKLEPPEGSPTRRVGRSRRARRADSQPELLVLQFQQEERGGDLRRRRQAALDGLLADADIFVSTCSPRRWRRRAWTWRRSARPIQADRALGDAVRPDRALGRLQVVGPGGAGRRRAPEQLRL
jgi:crotonobetainyl-CoA:carnitine CoA-transferase CaiB-like acyl-CoA transferase